MIEISETDALNDKHVNNVQNDEVPVYLNTLGGILCRSILNNPCQAFKQVLIPNSLDSKQISKQAEHQFASEISGSPRNILARNLLVACSGMS